MTTERRPLRLHGGAGYSNVNLFPKKKIEDESRSAMEKKPSKVEIVRQRVWNKFLKKSVECNIK